MSSSGLKEPAGDLLKPHYLRQNAGGSRQFPVIQLSQCIFLHLVVRLGLLVSERDVATHINLVRQIQAVFFQDPGTKGVEFFSQLIEPTILHNVRVDAVASVTTLDHRITALEGVEVVKAQGSG